MDCFQVWVWKLPLVLVHMIGLIIFPPSFRHSLITKTQCSTAPICSVATNLPLFSSNPIRYFFLLNTDGENMQQHLKYV